MTSEQKLKFKNKELRERVTQLEHLFNCAKIDRDLWKSQYKRTLEGLNEDLECDIDSLHEELEEAKLAQEELQQEFTDYKRDVSEWHR